MGPGKSRSIIKRVLVALKPTLHKVMVGRQKDVGELLGANRLLALTDVLQRHAAVEG